jgi:hypothetical protein
MERASRDNTLMRQVKNKEIGIIYMVKKGSLVLFYRISRTVHVFTIQAEIDDEMARCLNARS